MQDDQGTHLNNVGHLALCERAWGNIKSEVVKKGRAIHLLVDAMATITPNHRKAVILSMTHNLITDIPVPLTRTN